MSKPPPGRFVISSSASRQPFRLPIQAEKPPIHEIYDAPTRDDSRNALIVQDVLNVVRQGRSPLILTERIDHLDIPG